MATTAAALEELPDLGIKTNCFFFIEKETNISNHSLVENTEQQTFVKFFKALESVSLILLFDTNWTPNLYCFCDRLRKAPFVSLNVKPTALLITPFMDKTLTM
jgi:hypothetical protein